MIDGYSSVTLLKKLRSLTTGHGIIPGPSFAILAEKVASYHSTHKPDAVAFWKAKSAKFSSASGKLLIAQQNAGQIAVDDNASATVQIGVILEPVLAAARLAGVTPAATYYAAWALVLSLYSDSDCVVFGCVLSGRSTPIEGIMECIGPFVNTLPLHVIVDGAASTTDFLRNVFQDEVELSRYHYSLPEDGYSRSFSSTLALQLASPDIMGEGIMPIMKPRSRSIGDMPLTILIESDGMINVQYYVRAYPEASMRTLAETFKCAITSLCSPSLRIGECLEKFLDRRTRKKLQIMGNCIADSTTIPSIKDDLVSLFEAAVEKNPGGIAVEKGDDTMTYAQLNAAANVFAKYLAPFIHRGDVVGVHADRSVDWIVTIYGVLKAGAVYCPFDITLPAALRRTNFQSSGARVFVVPRNEDVEYVPGNC